MRNPSLLVASALLTIVIVFLPPSNKAWLYKWEGLFQTDSNKFFKLQDFNNDLNGQRNNSMDSSKATILQILSLQKSKSIVPYKVITFENKGQYYLNLDDIEEHVPVQGKVDFANGEIILMHGNSFMSMLKDVPVLNNNGIYQPMTSPPVIVKNEVWLPVSLIQDLFNQKISIQQNIAIWQERTSSVPVFAVAKRQVPKLDVKQMIDYLSFLRTPIKGARVSLFDSHMPGAPRSYRKGVHEGVDWYTRGTGVKIDTSTPVRSVADGVVVRADHNYKEMTLSERQRLLMKVKKNDGQTPEYILDKLRGRSIWIQYKKGIMARYVHLSRIPGNLKVGQKVKAGDVIGYVGNSGTSDGAKKNNQGLHLHIDLLIFGDWFWKNYTFQERRQILEHIFLPNE